MSNARQVMPLLDLERMSPQDGVISCGHLPGRVETPTTRWAYGLQIPLVLARPAAIRVTLRVSGIKGSVRVGVVNETGDFMANKMLQEGDPIDRVELRLSATPANNSLVVQNASQAGASGFDLLDVRVIAERPYDKQRTARVARYLQHGFNAIEGWCHYLNIIFLEQMDEVLFAYEVDGGVCEIGVHHGKHFIALHNLMVRGAKSVAIDVFDDQRFNLDHSGAGDRALFLANLAKWAAEPSDCILIAGDSLVLREPELAAIQAQAGLPKLFSIDGCHEVEHTLADLRTAMRLITPGGVIIVDDYLNQDFPGVHQAVARLFANDRPGIAPFAIGQNKLYLTHRSHHARYFEAAHEIMARIPETSEVRAVNLWDYKAWSWRSSDAGWDFPRDRGGNRTTG